MEVELEVEVEREVDDEEGSCVGLMFAPRTTRRHASRSAEYSLNAEKVSEVVPSRPSASVAAEHTASPTRGHHGVNPRWMKTIGSDLDGDGAMRDWQS